MECFTRTFLPCGFCFWLYEIVEGEEMEGKSACGIFPLILFASGPASRTFQFDVSGVQGLQWSEMVLEFSRDQILKAFHCYGYYSGANRDSRKDFK